MTPIVFFAVATFVGNSACKPCHADVVRRYEATPMAQSTGPIKGKVPTGSFRHAASNTEYTIGENGHVSMRRGRDHQKQQFDYAIGSGAAGFSYLIFRDGYLFQAPITWYSQKRRWDAAPGYQEDPVMAWDRPVDPSCLLCHASQLQHIYGTFNRYAETPFKQPGVSCERCHGPGSDHAQGKAKMVVPSRLDAERRDDVCRQCHLMGEARVPRPGKAFGEYRAGDRLGDYVAYFVKEDPRPALKTTGHTEGLNVSRCKQMSGDKMWCGTCHDPHTTPTNSAAWFGEKCQTCHAVGLAGGRPCGRGANCIACHMPKSPAIDAGHGSFTDHRIARRPEGKRIPSDTWRLRPFGPADRGDRELGLAYLEVYKRTRDERQRNEAERILGVKLRVE